MLADFQRSDLRFQSGRGSAELGCRTARPGNSTPGFCQGSLNQLPLAGDKAVGERFASWLSLRGLGRKPFLVNRESLWLRENERSLDHVLKLTSVARPG